MAKKNNKGRAAHGAGSIRKKTVTTKGKTYTYWEARITTGTDPGTGKQMRRSFSGKTQKEVLEKMRAASVELKEGTYVAPSKMTLGEWLDIWVKDYLGNVKPRTKGVYTDNVELHIKPALGAVKLSELRPQQIQSFYNRAQEGGLSPGSIRSIHGTLHKAIRQAVALDYLKINPADKCKPPRVEKKEIQPLDSEAISAFITAVRGNRFENFFLVALFTGMREGEILGLTWDCIDFKGGTILIKQQLQWERKSGGAYHLVSPKSGKSRRIAPAASVMEILLQQQSLQAGWKSKAGPLWSNPSGFVFTNETGRHLVASTVYRHFKQLVESIGLPHVRFHDLRHSYAVAALLNGDDIKTVQQNLGHHTAAFTLDVYGHVTGQMERASAERMERFIGDVSNLLGENLGENSPDKGAKKSEKH